MTFTLVSFHAHPDDEALLTAGTLARAAAEGHRVVLVVATAGEAGLAASTFGHADELARRRLAELHTSADALGCARVEVLGYRDSGMYGEHASEQGAFAGAQVDVVAAELADLLREEQADVVTVYDPQGGYGHPDHVQVHRVGVRAAQMAGTPVVLEATVNRVLLQRVLRLVSRRRRVPAEFDPARFAGAFTAPGDITHRVNVRRHTRAKRAAMAAHVSQQTADEGDRTLAYLLRLPGPLFRLVLGQEWYVERGRRPSRPLLDDVFASLRDGEGAPPPGQS